MRNRVFCVVGPSASGKTSFAIKIAKCLKKRGSIPVIISIDVMQMYAGLPIATNKPTKEEKEEIPHIFIGYLDPFIKCENSEQSNNGSLNYGNPHNISEFVPKAVDFINKLHKEGKTVILTGGTLYYVQAILTDSLLCVQNESTDTNAKKAVIREMPTEELFAELQRVDPEMARRWHPNDYRHIRRSLEVFYETNGTKCAQIEKQSTDSPLRWADHIIFWIDCPMDWLFERIEARVAQMEAKGLCAEVTDFYFRQCPSDRTVNAFSKAIGYKEFLPYLEWIRDTRNRVSVQMTRKSPTTRCSKEASKVRVLWTECLTDLIQKTKQYCTKQVRWIRNKMTTVEAFQIFRVATWESESDERFLTEAEIDDITHAPLTSVQCHTKRVHCAKPPPVQRSVHFCDLCKKYLENDVQWNAHLSSRQHRKLKRKKGIAGSAYGPR